MPSPRRLAALAAASLLPATSAWAHGFAGPHMFISTLLIDDPNVADEASLPTFFYLPQPTDGGAAPKLDNASFEFDKRITENFGFSISDGYSWLRMPGVGTASGWQNLEATLKYKAYVNDEHEFMLSLGVSREFARTGATGANGATLDNDDSSSTTPTIYWGKGFGDIPVPLLRPLALTGTLSYTIADKKLKITGTDPDSGNLLFNNGTSNTWSGGLSLQVQLPLSANPSEGLRLAGVRQQADPGGRSRLVIAGEQAEPSQHAVPHWRRHQLHRRELCGRRRSTHPR